MRVAAAGVGGAGDTRSVSLYRDEAIVLRTHKLGEADRIVTLLTRSHGKVRAVGKGVRRTSSRFGSRLEPFMHVDVQLSTGRNLDIVTQAETLGAYGRRVCEDYTLYTAGTVMLETADRLVEAEREPSLQQYWLLVGAVRALAGRDHAPGLVLDSYLLRALAVAGLGAQLHRLRPLRRARSALRLRDRVGRRRLPGLPAPGCRGAGAARRSSCWPPCSRGTGPSPTPAPSGTAARATASSPRSASSTSSASCARCRWSRGSDLPTTGVGSVERASRSGPGPGPSSRSR